VVIGLEVTIGAFLYCGPSKVTVERGMTLRECQDGIAVDWPIQLRRPLHLGTTMWKNLLGFAGTRGEGLDVLP